MTEQIAIEQTYPPGKHPNSLANLRPWPPGQSGCPQRNNGAYISEWRTAMLGVKDDGTARYTKADLERIVSDDAAPPAKVIAARWILNCMKSGENWVIGKDGKPMPARIDSEPGRERERLMDRMEGKPPQQLIIQHQPAEKPAVLADELVALLDQQPELVDQVWPRLLRACNDEPMLRERLLPVLKKHHPDLARSLEPVETTAVAVPAD
ncbi:MAG: hypothetical protein IH983_03460 [Planctomycetes bacterium]|nr:hypothetical protein [Planctomycetota bacterium]